MPRLRVLAGPSPDELFPIQANSGKPARISSDAFEGQVAIYIKGFADAEGRVTDSEYFKKRSGVTWSIQVQGRYLNGYNADELLFGNIFDRPLKLPWVFSAALRFMNFIDPTLENDLASRTRPWALSPLIATMPYFHHARATDSGPAPAFPPPHAPINDDTSQLQTIPTATNSSGKGGKLKDSPSKRRSYFTNALRRQEVVLGPDDVVTTDFCYDFLQFSPDGIMLRLPGGISIEMTKYWDGQPVRFVCCERLNKSERTPERAWGRVLWCVVIEPAEGDEDSVGAGEKGKFSSEAFDITHALMLAGALRHASATMLHIGYEVWISDGQKERIPEYDVKYEGEDGKTIACYIPSESGKEFQIRWKDHNGAYAPHASMKIFVDGHVVGKTRCPPGVVGKRLGISTTSADTYQPFQFANLQTTDDDDALWGAGIPDKLGSIELHVVHVHPHVIQTAFRPAGFAGTGPVHERSKKAGAHCVE
ncbi:hypothetical protein DICSQDRAFT_128064 [Dichomitus squalens LYAD-421 SS1]|uniref:DUF1769-domain-containing protein n=1 Tax=Dichomitus squalens (strain LYAD-421) TaxID=732165 RepID=R7SV13_DICSQ|nr:uncharacterized protein DICSQDRAFT_128064 [Dichomitus squalens LYAD-421 SS1]EJF59728.1 hypothetical protein DICSQDRAFT_128064 [Dichomitus squalens LYAD-421 SS1]